MSFSSLFSSSTAEPQTDATSTAASDHPGSGTPGSEPIRGKPNQSELIRAEKLFLPAESWLFPDQRAWLADKSILRLWEKSRQIGATKTDALDSVLKASAADARLDVWVTSRDEAQALLYMDDCRDWAKILNLAVTYHGRLFLDAKKNSAAHILQFANGRKIYCLSSNPNALAGKRGHVKIDEFALHPDQRALFKVALPVTTWGGTLSILSTHRGPNSYFNQLIRDILHNGNPMGWSHHKTTIHDAISQGIVEKINAKTGRNESREQWEDRVHRQCGTEEAWLEEYCCIPSDESTAFLTHDMITACEDPTLKLLTTDQLIAWLSSNRPRPRPRSRNRSDPRDQIENPISVYPCPSVVDLYLGMDVGRTRDLTVIDVGIKIGDIMHDILRLELANTPFPKQEAELYRLLALPQLRRACIDANSIGMQLAEDARARFGSKVEPVHITAPVKEKLAFALRNDFESLALKISADPKLHADLHAMRKQITNAGNIRLSGQTDDSHCDRFMAKCLRQEAARSRPEEPWIYP